MEPNTTAVPEQSVEEKLRELSDSLYRLVVMGEERDRTLREHVVQEKIQAAYALGLRHMREQVRGENESAKALLRAIAEAMKEPDGGSWWPIRELADKMGIFNGDLDGPRIVPLLIEKWLGAAAAIRNLPVGGEK